MDLNLKKLPTFKTTLKEGISHLNGATAQTMRFVKKRGDNNRQQLGSQNTIENDKKLDLHVQQINESYHKLANNALSTGMASDFIVDKKGRTRVVVEDKEVKVKKFRIQNAFDAEAVGDLVCRVTPTCRIDPRSIGGSHLNKHSAKTTTSNLFLANECLLSLRVSNFEWNHEKAVKTSDELKKAKKMLLNQKARNKLRYICIVRSTNKPLLEHRDSSKNNKVFIKGQLATEQNDDDNASNQDSYSQSTPQSFDGMQEGVDVDGILNEDPDEDDEEGDIYHALYNPKYDGGSLSYLGGSSSKLKTNNKHSSGSNSHRSHRNQRSSRHQNFQNNLVSRLEERSSFPFLVSLVIYQDGTHPEIRKACEMDQLVAVQVLSSNNNNNNSNSNPQNNMVRMSFAGGDSVDIDLLPYLQKPGQNTRPENAPAYDSNSAKLAKQFFLWSMLQVHAILCTSVVEQLFSSRSTTGGGASSTALYTPLPTLVIRNLDRADLQYVSTVNGFLADSPAIAALLERQRNRDIPHHSAGNNKYKGEQKDADEKGEKENNNDEDDANNNNNKVKLLDDMDGMAWDMMMGNYGMRRATIFVSEDEKKDAEEILNSMPWQRGMLEAQSYPADDPQNTNNVGATAVAENLKVMLEKRMRDLEAETCRRLISWEDEKYISLTGVVEHKRDTDALSLAHLFGMLDKLDSELSSMEEWLEEKVTAITPLTNDCRGIEEENRQLEQQWKSYDLLGAELKRIFSGLEVPENLLNVLQKPDSALQYDDLGNIDVDASESGVELIHQAGKALKNAFDRAKSEGAVHLRSVSERVKELSSMANIFSLQLSKIVISVMDQLSADVVSNDSDFKQSLKHNSHTDIAKQIRNSQRNFQSSLLSFLKILEVIQLLKPTLLPQIRESYSDLVCDGILSKKKLKLYFASLPGKSTVNIASVTRDLSQYNAVPLLSTSESNSKGISNRESSDPAKTEHGIAETYNYVINTMKHETAQDIQLALSEILPIIAREAYFTAALFGMSKRQLDGREKKRNFEAAKRSVDRSSQYFRYYISRICGIASEADAEGKKVSGDAMLSLVASIHLNEALESYIDRQKKGGDHSLSLAYVRATILELRKKVDRQWVTWVENQIKWIKMNPGVPLNGKRAGVFATFSRFPAYLDHVMACCKAARPENYVPKFSAIKVTTYYMQKMAGALFSSLQECAERDSTDQQYAANVMRMENSFFFTQSIKHRGQEFITLFSKQISAATAICKSSTDAYLGWMIKREFKSLHSLFSNISRIRRDVGDADVPIHVPRSTFVKTLQKESNRDVMKEKIQTIYDRMEKHLSEAGGLLPVAWKALVKVLYEWFGRWEKLSTQCYKYVLDPSAVDVVRIAKAAGGVGIVRNHHSNDKNAKTARPKQNMLERNGFRRGPATAKAYYTDATRDINDNEF